MTMNLLLILVLAILAAVFFGNAIPALIYVKGEKIRGFFNGWLIFISTLAVIVIFISFLFFAHEFLRTEHKKEATDTVTVTNTDFQVIDSTTIVSQLKATRKSNDSLPDIRAFQ